jgi:hypothetical protein
MWDFVVDKVAMGQVFSEYFGFPLPIFIPPITPQSLSSGAGTIGQKWPQYLGTSSHPTNNNKKHWVLCSLNELAVTIY